LDDHPNVLTTGLAKAEQKIGVKRRYIIFAVWLLMVVYLIVGYAAPLVCNFIGFVYPAYCSVKAIESRGTSDDTAWLMYWVVYSSFSCLEFFSDIILSWLPFYYFLKCVFLGWCMGALPFAGNGSTLIYKKFIRPFVLKNEDKIDEALGVLSDQAGKLAGEATGINSLAQTVLKCSTKCKDAFKSDTFSDIQETCQDTFDKCKNTYKDTFEHMSYKSLDEDRSTREAYKSLEPEDSCREDSFSEIRGTCAKGSDNKHREYLISSSDSDDMESCVQEQQQSAVSDSIASGLTSLIGKTTGGNFNRDSNIPDPREFIKKLLESAYEEERGRRRKDEKSSREKKHSHF